MSVLARLDEYTYVHEHNPNCPSPHLVRLVTGGYRGYGQTFEEAAAAALKHVDARQEESRMDIAEICIGATRALMRS